MSSRKGDEEKKILPVVLIPNTTVFRQAGGQLMVAMQPGVELPAVDVQEVVVVTGDGRRYYADDDNRDDGQYEDNEVDYDVRSETVAAEIEVADVRVFEEFLVNGRNRGEHRVRHRMKKTRFKRHFTKKVPAKTVRKQRESLPEFDDSESDIGEYMYGGSPRKPRKRDFAHRLQWSDDNMKAAMKAVEDKKMTIRGAAKRFNVPYSTLKDRVRGRVRHGTKPGVKTVLSPEEEEELVKCIKQMEAGGFQLHCINIRERAGELLSLNRGYNTPYQGSIPGHNWLAGFLKRHKGIEMKRSVNRLVAPSTAKQKQMLKRFYETASNAYKELTASIQESKGNTQRIVQGNHIYTMTEIQFSAFPNTSIIIAASASGIVLPPFVLFCGSRSLVPRLQELFPLAYFFVSSSSRIREDILLSWFRDHFLKHVQSHFTKYPVVLFVSQPINNISVRLMQLSTDNDVSLVCIPHGISHLVQPLNDSVLREMDETVGKRGRKWLEERKQTTVDRFGMAEILQKVWQKGLPSNEVIANFEENGLFPLNIRAVSTERIMSSTPSTDALKQSSSDNETNGLALLSELSSTQYASMEHLGEQSTEGPSRSFNFKRKRAASDELFEFSPMKRRHRNTAENSQFGLENINRSRQADHEIHNALGPKVSQELIRHVLCSDDSEASCSRTRPVPRIVDRRQLDIHQEILASRTNHEQLKQAINSITDDNSRSTFSVEKDSQVFVSPNPRTFRLSSGYCASPAPAKRNRSKVNMANIPKNIDVLTSGGNMSKFVTLKPVRHVVQISPNIKQEYISYVEDETQRVLEEEFVPQEMVEEQTIIQDCMTYDMSSEPFCKEEIIEGVVEEVIELPDLDLMTEEVVDEAEVKLENIEAEYMNNNELAYNLQSDANGAAGDGFEAVASAGTQLKTIKIADLKSRFDLNQRVKIIKLQTVNGQTVQIMETLSMQEFIRKNGGNTLSSIP